MMKSGATAMLLAAFVVSIDAFTLNLSPLRLRPSSNGHAAVSVNPAGRCGRRALVCQATVPETPTTQEGGVCDSAARRYWQGMNDRDIDFALEQFSDDIFFQDMMFSEPITSKAGLRAHFETCLEGFPEGLVFVIDEISKDAGDGCCGAYWHCETPEGKAFPFSRGLSFYKCDSSGKLSFAREIPEPSTKPGPAGLALAKFGSFMMQFVPESVTFPKV